MQDRRRPVEQLGAFFMNMSATFLKPMHPERYRFVAIFATIAAALFWLRPPLGWIGDIVMGDRRLRLIEESFLPPFGMMTYLRFERLA